MAAKFVKSKDGFMVKKDGTLSVLSATNKDGTPRKAPAFRSTKEQVRKQKADRARAKKRSERIQSSIKVSQDKRNKVIKLKDLYAKRSELKAIANSALTGRSIEFYVVLRSREGNYYHRGPHKQQQKFHADKSSIRIVEGGNRSGKSACGINEDVAYAVGHRPWLDEGHPDYKIDVQVPNKGLIVGESFGEQVQKVLVPKLLGDIEKGLPGAIPKHLVQGTKKNPQGVTTFIKLTNGSTIDLQAYSQDVDLFESNDYDWIHYDEPPPRAIWIASQRGLTDRLGKSWLTMTPLKEAWIHDEMVLKKVERKIGCFRFDIEDNLGYGLTREGIDLYASNLSPDEKEARLRGRYFHLVGTVYKSYDSIHMMGRCKIDAQWNIYFHIDTHPRTPHHALWVACLPDDTLRVIGELKNSDANNLVDPFCDAIFTYERETLGLTFDQITNMRRLIDPSSSIKSPVDNISIADAFIDNGIVAVPGSKNRDAGILLAQKALSYDDATMKRPSVYVFDDLTGFDYEMKHYVWEENKGKTSHEKEKKQVPRDKNDHYVECFHRILLDEPKFRYFSNANVRHARKKPACRQTGY